MNSKATPIIDKGTIVQFDMLSQIDALLRPANIRFWLRGGWAIDFLLGHVTRSHSDIDIVAWKRDASLLHDLFVQAGFLFIRDIGVQYDFSKFGQEISAIFIVQNDANVIVEGIPNWVWLPNALSFAPKQLNGLWCNVLSPEQLLEEKKGYQSGTGRPLRPKDLQSIEILRNIHGAGG